MTTPEEQVQKAVATERLQALSTWLTADRENDAAIAQRLTAEQHVEACATKLQCARDTLADKLAGLKQHRAYRMELDATIYVVRRTAERTIVVQELEDM